MARERDQHFTLSNIGSQQLHLTFDGGRIVSDAGLLAVRALEKPLRVIADLAQRLPDPRAPKFIEHAAETLLTQADYQILAGYPDFNDAQQLRGDPLFQILADVRPDADNPLASPSTLSRFQYAYTRRQGVCRRLLLVANVGATLPDADTQPIEPAPPRCCPRCGGTRLVYRELTPAEPAALSAAADSS